MANVTETNVELEADGKPIFAALDAAKARIEAIQKQIGLIVAESAKGADGFDKKISNQVSALQAALGQMKTLSKFAEDGGKGKGPIVAANAERSLAGATLKAAQFRKGIDQASNAIEAMNARMSKVDQKIARFGSMGVTSGPAFEKLEAQRKNLTTQLDIYGKISAAQESLDRKAARTKGVDSAVQFKAEREKLAAAKLALEEKIMNPRARSFSGETATALQAVKSYESALDGVRDKKAAILKQDRDQRQAEQTRFKAMSDYDKALLQAEKQRADQMKLMWAAEDGRKLRGAYADPNKATRAPDLTARQEALIKAELERAVAQRKADAEHIKAQQAAAEIKRKADESAMERRRKLDVQYQKSLIPTQTAGVLAGGNGEAAKLDLIRRVLKAKQDFQTADEKNKQQMLDILKLEQSRLGELVRQTKQAEALRRASDITGIQYQKTQIPTQIATKLGALGPEAARLDLLGRVNAAHNAFLVAQEKDKKHALDILKLEQARLAELEKQIKAKEREAAAAARQGQPHAILPSGGFGTVIARTAAYAAAGSGIFAVVGALQQGFSFALEFEDALVKLQAVAGATDGQMAKLTESIIDVGRVSRFSLSELSEAATGLAQAGFSVADIENSLMSVQTLAAASGSTLAQSVDLTTSAISAFSLSTDNAARIADGMVSALNRSKLTVGDVASAIQTVGSTAAASNMTLQELTGTIGAMTQSGVRGQMASTGLRQFMIDLTNPSKDLSEQLIKLGLTFDDVDIATRGLPAVLQTLSSSGFGAAEAYGSLENRSAAAYLTMRKQIPMINELVAAQNDVGAATAAAAKATDSFTSQWQMFKTNLGAGAFSLVEMLGLDTFIKKINEGADSARFLSEYRKKNPLQGDGQDNVRAGRAVEQYNKAKHALDEYNEKLDAASTALKTSSDEMVNQQQRLTSLDAAMNRMVARQDNLKDGSTALSTEVASMSTQFVGLAKYLDMTNMSFGNLMSAAQAYRKEQALVLLDMAQINAGKAEATQKVAADGANSTFAAMYKSFTNIPKDIDAIMKAANAGNLTAILQLRDLPKNLDPAFRAAAKQAADQLITRENNRNQATNSNTLVKAIQISQEPGAVARMTELQGLSNSDQDRPRLKAILDDIDRDIVRAKNDLARIQALQAQRSLAETKMSRPGSFQTADTTASTRAADRAATDSAAMKRLLEDPRIGATVTATKDDHAKYVAGTTRISDHFMDKAIDFVPKGGMGSMTKDEVRKMFQDLGVKIRTNAQGVEQLFGPGDKGHNDHWHAAWEGSAPSTDALDQADTSNSQLAANTADKDLKEKLKERKKATSALTFDELSKAAEASFAAWEVAYRKLNDDQSKTFTPSQKADRLLQVNDAIQQKRDEFQDKLVDDLTGMVERSFDQITKVFEAQMQPFDLEIAKLQGQAQGFELASNQGRVPDYVKTINAQKLGKTQEARQRFELSQLPDQITQKNGELSLLTDPERVKNLSGDQLDKQKTSVMALTAELNALEKKRAELEQVFGAQGLIPQSFSQGFDQAIAAIKGSADFGMTFSEQMTQGIGGALMEVREGFGTFFSDILTGSQTVLGAFGNFASGIIKMMEQMVAKALAMQLFNFLVGLVGPSVGAAPADNSFSGGVSNFNLSSLSGNMTGGLIGRARGGPINQGTAARDSVLTKLSKGEYVVQKSAVDSVGTSFMENLNRNGAQSLKGMQAMPQLIAPQAKQEMKVFVVAPTAKPQMSPSDVLLILQDDMLKGGTTKQLVRHISQGG